MKIRYQTNCKNIDWELIPHILKTVGMGHGEVEIHQKAFENSHAVVFVFDDDKLIGFGRAISDDAYQAALYDFAILPEYQGAGIGRGIYEKIHEKISHCHTILYAAIGKEGFYETFGFRKMKTGMARFLNAEEMKEKGFTE